MARPRPTGLGHSRPTERSTTRSTMTSHTPRVGVPALSDGPRTLLEGGQIAFDGATVQFILAVDRPTRSEVRAVARGPVELGLYHLDGLAAVVVVAGDPRSPGYLEASAPLLLDRYEATPHPAPHGDRPDAVRVQLVLCQAHDAVVRVVRDGAVPHPLARAIQKAAHTQAQRFAVAPDAVRAHEVGLRALTAAYLLRHAVARTRLAGWCAALLCCL